MVLNRYRDVLAERHVTRLLVTSELARLPQGMGSLALLLLLTPQVGYARAGVAAGISVATGGVSGVLLARAVDRYGARLVLVPAAAVFAAAMVALAASRRGPYLLEVAICAAIGLATPPITAVARGLWSRLLDPDRAQAIYGLEATAQELVYVAGPALVALIAGLASAAIAVAVTGLAGLLGTVAYVSSPPFAVGVTASRRPRQRVLRGTGLARYVFTGACLTTAFGMTDVGVVAFVGGRHAAAGAGAGVVLAVWSAGSLVGGLLFGTSSSSVTDRGLAGWITSLAASLAVAALAPGPVVLGILLVLSGVTIAPSLARLYTRVGAVAPEGATTEAFGWLSVGFIVGYSAGSALGGVTTDSIGARFVFVVAGVAVALGAAVAVSRRPSY